MTTSQDAFTEPAADQRYRYNETGDIITYGELVKDTDPDLRPADAVDYENFLNINDITPID